MNRWFVIFSYVLFFNTQVMANIIQIDHMIVNDSNYESIATIKYENGTSEISHCTNIQNSSDISCNSLMPQRYSDHKMALIGLSEPATVIYEIPNEAIDSNLGTLIISGIAVASMGYYMISGMYTYLRIKKDSLFYIVGLNDIDPALLVQKLRRNLRVIRDKSCKLALSALVLGGAQLEDYINPPKLNPVTIPDGQFEFAKDQLEYLFSGGH